MKYKTRQLLSTLLALLLTGTLASCGGGNDTETADGGVGTGGTGCPVGTVQVAVTDAPAPQFHHVWVTIEKVRIHIDANAGPDDAGWLDYHLPKPATIDLAELNNGAFAELFGNFHVREGNYGQIRFVLAGDDDALTRSAELKGLKYNDQVDYTNDTGRHIEALEIASPAQGISVNGHFSVKPDRTLRLMFDFNIGEDVVKFSRNGVSGYTLKPVLTYFDMDRVGAVTGQIDMASLKIADARDVIIQAENSDTDGARHSVLRSTSITAKGKFTLYPITVPDRGWPTTVDLVILGRNMDTMIIKGVPVKRGSTPHSDATELSPIYVNASSEYKVNLQPGTLNPTGAWVELYQTLPGAGETPYEVHLRQVDPYSDKFDSSLPVSSGLLWYTNYERGDRLSFASTAPVEGNGAFQAWGVAPNFQSAIADAPVTPPPADGTALIAMPKLQPASGFSADSISGVITQAWGHYDSGYLVLTHNGLITETLNLSDVLAQGGGSGGAYTVSNLPGGSFEAKKAGSYYYAYVVVWNSARPKSTLHEQAVSGHADLSVGDATGFDLTLK